MMLAMGVALGLPSREGLTVGVFVIEGVAKRVRVGDTEPGRVGVMVPGTESVGLIEADGVVEGVDEDDAARDGEGLTLGVGQISICCARATVSAGMSATERNSDVAAAVCNSVKFRADTSKA
jgi:hypothetical protein